MKQYFGTDGIRGRVGESVVTPEFVLKLGWAIGNVLTNGVRKQVLIGKDTRVSGYLLESALEAGLSAAGVDIRLLGPMPTPAIAYLTQTFRASAGIVISASHNPYHDNGIKFFSQDGTKLSDEVECAIERALSQPMTTVSADLLGKASRVDDAPGRYVEFCKSCVPSHLRLNGLKMVVDCANGATYHIAPNVFRELGAEVITLACEPNGFNINEACGSMHPEHLSQAVIAERADIGVAFDGDGDRVVIIDEYGQLIDGDQIIFMIAKDWVDAGRRVDGVVGTMMSNLGLEASLNAIGIPFERTQVGDRHVSDALRKNQWQLGGESSGHIICSDRLASGDGIIAALQVLVARQRAGRPLSNVAHAMKKFPQAMRNIRTLHAVEVIDSKAVSALKEQLERQSNDSLRVLLRASGTEPLVRIMVQGQQLEHVEHAASALAEQVSSTAQAMV